jgi:hypothetical protein
MADDHVSHIVADAIVHAAEQRTPPDDADAVPDVPHQPTARTTRTIRGGSR